MLIFMQKGGPVMYPLIVCSLVSLTFIIERTLFWIRQTRGRNQEVVNQILDMAKQLAGQQIQVYPI